jgi:D-alanyl-D-alanine carboxypeptidase
VSRPVARVPRAVSVTFALVTVVAGLGVRALLPDAVGGPLGDTLYAVLLVWLVVLVVPAATSATAAALGLLASVVVEASHLTDVPTTVLAQVPAARYVLGTTFGLSDLAWYALGATLAGLLLAVVRPRPTTVDEALRHVRVRPGRAGTRWIARVLVPLALLATIAVAGLGVMRILEDEDAALALRLDAARSELDASSDRVADEAVRSALVVEIGEGETMRLGAPVLERRPGDAVDAVEDLDEAVDAVRASRRVHATEEAAAARATLDAPQDRAAEILSVTDALADDGKDAGTARASLRDAVSTVQELLESTEPDLLAEMPLDDLEVVAGTLATSRDAVGSSTTALMTAQDAVSCPEDDQRWDPAAGKVADDDLAAIPWAPQHRVRADLLDSLVALDDAYVEEFGQHLTVNSGYRSYDDQVEVFNPQDPNPLAAPPGCSNHGLGTAVDVSMGPDGFDGDRFAWMTEHAGELGWTHPDWAGPTGRLPEPWHWESVETPHGY